MTNKSFVVTENRRCFLCGKLTGDSCLLIVDDYGFEKDNTYFCGECVYYTKSISRPFSNWESDKEKLRKKRAEQRKKNKEKRKHEKWLSQFCCKQWGQFIYTMRGFNQTVVLENGVIMLYSYDCYDDYDSRDFDDSGNYNFIYCPYCRKEFIRKKRIVKMT